MSTTEPTVCIGNLVYRDQHQAADRWFILYTPSGERVAACSWACLLEYMCEPMPAEAVSMIRTPLRSAPDQRRRRLELVK